MPRIVIAIFISSFAALGFASTAMASTLTAAGLGVRLSASNVVHPVDFKCGLVNGKLVCGKKGSKQQDDDEDDCDPGYVVLDKPNK